VELGRKTLERPANTASSSSISSCLMTPIPNATPPGARGRSIGWTFRAASKARWAFSLIRFRIWKALAARRLSLAASPINEHPLSSSVIASFAKGERGPRVAIKAKTTEAENVYVHIIQKRQTITRWIESCSLTLCMIVLAARIVSINEGAYWLLIGSTGFSTRAWTKKLR